MNLAAIAAGEGDSMIPLGAELLRFASAAADLRGDESELLEAREALVAASSEAWMVDSAAVAANFQMMTRLADGTGARYPEARLNGMAATITAMGTAELTSRR